MITREEVQSYLQDMANRIKNTRECAPLSLKIDKLFACMNMAKVLLDADSVTVDGNWNVTIIGGRS